MTQEELTLAFFEDNLSFKPEWHYTMRELPKPGRDVIITKGDYVTIVRGDEPRLPITTNVVFDGIVFKVKPFELFGKKLGDYVLHESYIRYWAYVK